MPSDKTPSPRWFLGLLAMTMVGALVPGCVHEPVCVEVCENCENSEFLYENQLAWLSPVTIVPVPGDAKDPRILMAFCTELATALRDRGVAEVGIRGNGQQHCEAKLRVEPSSPVDERSSLLMFVALPDFRAFRPMRMAVDVRVVQPEDERELIRVVEVFVGPQETPLRESPREIRLFREREREETADREAYTAFHTNSPRWFLTDSARRVTDRLSFVEPPASAASLPATSPDTSSVELPDPLPGLSDDPSPFPIEVPSLPLLPSMLPDDSLAPAEETSDETTEESTEEPPLFPFPPPELPGESPTEPEEPPTFPGEPPPLPGESATTPTTPGSLPKPDPHSEEKDAPRVPYALLAASDR